MRILLILAMVMAFTLARPTESQAGTCGPDLLIGPVMMVVQAIPPALKTIAYQTDDRLRWHKTHFHYERKCKVHDFFNDIEQALTLICGTMDGMHGLMPPNPLVQQMQQEFLGVASGLNAITAAGQSAMTPAQFDQTIMTEMVGIDAGMSAIAGLMPETDSPPTTYWTGGHCNNPFK